MELWLERSVWSNRSTDPARAAAFHIDGLARWLRSAGAEGRLVVLYVSGPKARAQLEEGLQAGGCQLVSATATAAAPIHPALASHQGDHFNDKLFVIDGFEVPEPAPLFRHLGANVATLSRTATWAAVIIESLTAMAAFEEAGGIVRRHAGRRLAILADDLPTAAAESPIPPAVRARWQTEHRVAEGLFHAAMATAEPPDYLGFSRVVRSGWAPLFAGPRASPEWSRLLRLWFNAPLATGPSDVPFPAIEAGPASAEAFARHMPEALRPAPVLATLARALEHDPAARYAARLPVEDVPFLAALDRVRRASEAGEAAHPADLGQLASPPSAPNLAIHAALTLGAEAAGRGDLEACLAAIEQADRYVAAEGLAITPELAFDVIEKRIQVLGFTSQRAAARAGLDRLADLLPRLCSPFYEGRLALARAEFNAPLDPAKARSWAAEAAARFREFGYDAWVAQAQAVVG